jgi:hypothetical protein
VFNYSERIMSMMEAARLKGAKFYETGKPCAKGHVAPRYVSTRQCVECVAAHAKAWGKGNKEKRNAISAKWRDENPNAYIDSAARSREKHAARIRARAYAWAKTTEGKAYRTMKQREREVACRRATPPWLTEEHRAQLRGMYIESAKTTEDTGVRHEVDHIVPLKHSKVCGLHVPWNLRVIPAEENARKYNTFT